MYVMVALVGAQPLPNLLPVRQDRPDALLLVETTRTEQVAIRLGKTLQSETRVIRLRTDPYDIPTIITALNQRLNDDDLAGATLSFNLTGGTKAMALAAYQVAQQRNAAVLYLESEGKRTRIYRYQWHNGRLDPTSSEIAPPSMTIEDFLNVSLGPGVWSITGPQRDEGTPFEIALGDTLTRCGYDVRLGVKAYGKIDINLLVRCDDQFAIIEAKAGKNGKKLDGLKQLQTAGTKLGLYTQQCYVIAVPPSPDQTAVIEASKVHVISLQGYVEGSTVLTEEDEATLAEAIARVLKV